MRPHAYAIAVMIVVACGESLPSAPQGEEGDPGTDASADSAVDDVAVVDGGDEGDGNTCRTAPCNVQEVAIAKPPTIAASLEALVWVAGDAVMKLLPGGGPITQMAPDVGGIPSGYVAVDSTLVLMTNANGVRRCPVNAICGSNPSSPIYGLSDPGPIAIGSTDMYTAERANARRVVTCGLTTNCDTSPEVVAYLPATPTRLALTTSSVVVGLSNHTVRAYPKTARPDAGAPVPEPIVTLGDLQGLATDGPDVYWADGTAGTIGTCNVDSCAVTKRVLATQRGYPRAVAVSAGGLYWVETNANEVLRCSLPACADATVIARVLRPNDLALGDRVYVTSDTEQKIYATSLR